MSLVAGESAKERSPSAVWLYYNEQHVYLISFPAWLLNRAINFRQQVASLVEYMCPKQVHEGSYDDLHVPKCGHDRFGEPTRPNVFPHWVRP